MGMTNPSDATAKKNDHKGVTFIGTVSDNKDPSKLKRVRISVPGLIDGDGDALPWAMPVTDDFEHVKVPEVGTAIYVQLQNGDKHYPIYFGSSTSNKQAIPSILTENYPNRYGMKDSKDNYYFVDKTTGVVEFQHHSGTKITIEDSGDVTLHCAGTITSDASVWNHTGDFNVVGSITATVEVTAADIPLTTHLTSGVKGGPDTSGPPIP